MKRDHFDLDNWVEVTPGVFQSHENPFDGLAISLDTPTVDHLLTRIRQPRLNLQVFCSKCREIVDFSGYCEHCADLSHESTMAMIERGLPMPEPPPVYCRCRKLRDYCMCHVNLALFSCKKLKRKN